MKLFATAFGIITLLTTLQANAVIIGDKDWRQVTDTVNNSWNDFDTIFDTSTGACEVTGCMLGSLDLTGYIWANNAEVGDLFTSGFGLASFPSLTAFSIVEQAVDALDPLFMAFGATTSSPTNQFINGRTRDSGITGGSGTSGRIEAQRRIGAQDLLVDFTRIKTSGPDDRSGSAGGWLYTTVNVPEPSVIALFGVGLFGLGFARRRKAQS